VIDFVSDVVHQHGGEAKYIVLVYHHSIYSPADHANDTDNQKRRRDFPEAFSQLGVDLVLQGHDHSYSRSYVIENGFKQNAGEAPGATRVFQDRGGVVYVTGN
jgi:3',5'-cyclic AMP phosphodiesterase CpdA